MAATIYIICVMYKSAYETAQRHFPIKVIGNQLDLHGYIAQVSINDLKK